MESESVVSKTTKRALRNQLIMRSAPLVGRGLTTLGVGGIAYSAKMPTTITVEYSLQTRKAAKQRMIKTERGYVSQYDDAIFREKRSGVKKVWLPGHPVAQTKRMAKNPPIGIPKRIASPSKIARMRAMRAAGFGTVLLGKSVPVIAVGYVGHSLISGETEKVNRDVQRLLYGGTIEEHQEMIQDVSEQTVLGSPYAVIALRTGFSVGFGAITGIFS